MRETRRHAYFHNEISWVKPWESRKCTILGLVHIEYRSYDIVGVVILGKKVVTE